MPITQRPDPLLSLPSAASPARGTASPRNGASRDLQEPEFARWMSRAKAQHEAPHRLTPPPGSATPGAKDRALRPGARHLPPTQQDSHPPSPAQQTVGRAPATADPAQPTKERPVQLQKAQAVAKQRPMAMASGAGDLDAAAAASASASAAAAWAKPAVEAAGNLERVEEVNVATASAQDAKTNDTPVGSAVPLTAFGTPPPVPVTPERGVTIAGGTSSSDQLAVAPSDGAPQTQAGGQHAAASGGAGASPGAQLADSQPVGSALTDGRDLLGTTTPTGVTAAAVASSAGPNPQALTLSAPGAFGVPPARPTEEADGVPADQDGASAAVDTGLGRGQPLSAQPARPAADHLVASTAPATPVAATASASQAPASSATDVTAPTKGEQGTALSAPVASSHGPMHVSPVSVGPPAASATPSPVAQATVAVPMGHPGFAEAVSNPVTVWIGQGVQEARLHLNPQDAGPVQVWIALEGAQAQVRFVAEQPPTRDALQAALPELALALGREGVTLEAASVQTQAQAQGQTPQNSHSGHSGFAAGGGAGDAWRGRRPNAAGRELVPQASNLPARVIGGVGANLLDLYA